MRRRGNDDDDNAYNDNDTLYDDDPISFIDSQRDHEAALADPEAIYGSAIVEDSVPPGVPHNDIYASMSAFNNESNANAGQLLFVMCWESEKMFVISCSSRN
jgi:hypothetical protein